MGIYSNAKLIYGAVVTVECGEEKDSPFVQWDDEDDSFIDWADLPEPLVLIDYGHYEDPDAHRAVLSSREIENFSADCWDPTRLGKWDLNVEDYQAIEVEQLIAGVALIDEDLAGRIGWNLVASVG